MTLPIMGITIVFALIGFFSFVCIISSSMQGKKREFIITSIIFLICAAILCLIAFSQKGALFDDKKSVPFMAVEVRTPLFTKDLAGRIYGDEGAIKEHPALYSFSPDAIDSVINQLDVFPPCAYVMDVYNRNR